MRVFRVGHATRTIRVDDVRIPVGPYSDLSASDSLRDMVWSHSRPCAELHHPSPDFCPELRYIDLDEVCAFDSMPALLDWFESWHRTLAENGFRIWIYDVPDSAARVGTFGQVVFRPARARLVDVQDFELKDEQLTLF